MLQIIMLVVGIIALVRGRFKLTRSKEVTGTRARIVGAILIAPFPIALCIGVVVGTMSALNTGGVDEETIGSMTYVDLGLAAAGIVAALAVAAMSAKPVDAAPTGFAPPAQTPTGDPNNPYASPFGRQNPPMPPRT